MDETYVARLLDCWLLLLLQCSEAAERLVGKCWKTLANVGSVQEKSCLVEVEDLPLNELINKHFYGKPNLAQRLVDTLYHRLVVIHDVRRETMKKRRRSSTTTVSLLETDARGRQHNTERG